MQKVMMYLVNTIGVNKTTNTKLKSFLEKLLVILIAVILCIDWDKTLDNLGIF